MWRVSIKKKNWLLSVKTITLNNSKRKQIYDKHFKFAICKRNCKDGKVHFLIEKAINYQLASRHEVNFEISLISFFMFAIKLFEVFTLNSQKQTKTS